MTPLAPDPLPAPPVASVRQGRLGLGSRWLGLRHFRLSCRGDFVDACLVDLTRGWSLRVVDSAELVVAVWESAKRWQPL